MFAHREAASARPMVSLSRDMEGKSFQKTRKGAREIAQWVSTLMAKTEELRSSYPRTHVEKPGPGQRQKDGRDLLAAGFAPGSLDSVSRE